MGRRVNPCLRFSSPPSSRVSHFFTMVRGQQYAPSVPQDGHKPRRQRASPARLVKLYKDLTEPQKKMIRSKGFGGLVKIGSHTLPTDFADWLMGTCYDPDASELGDEVRYVIDVEAINFIHEEFNIEAGIAPSIDSIMERVKSNKAANDDFLWSWLMIAISTFLCPLTCTTISPTCYPSIVDLSKVKKLNWCQFVVDQLKISAAKMVSRRSFKGCLLALVILYADSLDHNIQVPRTMPRVSAWPKKLLDEVINLDTNKNGFFGRLKLKGLTHCIAQPTLFHMDGLRGFVSTKVSNRISKQATKAITTASFQLCSGFTDILGTYLEQISEHVEVNRSRAAEPIGSTKRRRASCSEGEPSSAQTETKGKVPKSDHGSSPAAQVQTRKMRSRHSVQNECLDEEYEEDSLSDGSGSEEDSEDEEGYHSESDDEADDNAFDGFNGNGNLSPIFEDGLDDEAQRNEKQHEKGSNVPEEGKVLLLHEKRKALLVLKKRNVLLL